MSYKVTSDFELNEKQYKVGDVFDAPDGWKEEKKHLDDGSGIRFLVPFSIEGNESSQWIILPLEKTQPKASKVKE